MNFELVPGSPQGIRLSELADKHAVDFAATADEYDRDGAFAFPHWDRMRRSGLLAASVPDDLGGLGVTSVLDLVVAVSRLARGDSSIAIGAAMHLSAFWYLARLADGPPGLDHAERARWTALLRLLLRRCARGQVVACVAISEHGAAAGWPRTTAMPDGGGYRIDGRKTFCTASPVGTLFLGTLRMPGRDGTDRLGFAVVPRLTPGLTVLSNWDAMGMRASGSNDVVLDGCLVPAHQVTEVGPLGVLGTGLLPMTMVGVLALVGAALGIAERAQELLTGGLSGPPPRASVRTLVAENEVDLAVSRAAVGRIATIVDDTLATRPSGSALHNLMMQVQCVNLAVKRAAIAIVDRALTVSGGRGYLNANPLSRLYRDVRAGPFMQPFSALDAHDYIGAVRLGLEPD